MNVARAVVVGWMLAVGAAGVGQAAQQPGAREPARTVSLRPKWSKGQELRYTLRLDVGSRTESEEAGLSGGNTIQQDIGLLLRVKEVNAETGAVVDLVYESLKLKMTQDDTVIEFDSDKPAKADDANDPLLRPIVGLTLELRLDRDGNIKSISGGEKLAGTQAAAIANNFTGADIIKSLMGPVFSLRPGRAAAAVGDTWTNEDVITAALGDMKLTTTTTLKSLNGAVANLGIRGTIALTPSGGTGGLPPISIKDSSFTGDAQWNTETGSLVTMTTKQSIKTEVKLGDQVIRSTNDMTALVKRVGK